MLNLLLLTSSMSPTKHSRTKSVYSLLAPTAESLLGSEHSYHDLKDKQGEIPRATLPSSLKDPNNLQGSPNEHHPEPQRTQLVQPKLLPWHLVFTLRLAGPSSINPQTCFHLLFRTFIHYWLGFSYLGFYLAGKSISPKLLKI